MAKLYAYWITVNYREAYGMYACNGILFNHESPAARRDLRHPQDHPRRWRASTPGLQDCLYSATSTPCATGATPGTTCEMQWLMLQQESPEDFVIATGEQHSVREFVNLTAAKLDMKLRWQGEGIDEKAFDEWGRCIVAVDPRYFRPTEVDTLLGDAAKAHAKLGWKPKTSFDQLVTEMVEADYEIAKRDALVRDRGYKIHQHMSDAARSNYIPKDARIFVAGHRGLAGSAIVRRLRSQGYENLLLRTHQELDLRTPRCAPFLRRAAPGVRVSRCGQSRRNPRQSRLPRRFHLAKSAHSEQRHRCAHRFQADRLLFLGSSCIYPKLAPQPITEDQLLTGPLESTNRSYAVAKIAGIEMCWAFNRQHGTRFLAAMPTNLYGPGDNYHLEHSHVLPALIRKVHEAKTADESAQPTKDRCMGHRQAEAGVPLQRRYGRRLRLSDEPAGGRVPAAHRR